ncbi:MAG: hypothetical protein LBH36_02405 [Candidatus Nomurabacteria bacterium]|jgi:hypothetical protein|nr:hypothetical protein [Candidatus Nomurabacteria bacterium]
MAFLQAWELNLPIRASQITSRSVGSELELPRDTELEFVERQSRQPGTAYSRNVYRIVGTDDAVVVRHDTDTAKILAGYFQARKDYGAACSKAARNCGLPFEVVLAVGPDNAEEFAQVAKSLRGKVSQGEVYELSCGIGRRKAALGRLLPESRLKVEILAMGQKNSTRVAEFVASL